MAKKVTEQITHCDDCTFQKVFAESLFCSKLNEDIYITEGESFPFDCPLENEEESIDPMDENILYLSPPMYNLLLERAKIETDAPLELDFQGERIPIRKLSYAHGNQLMATGWLAEVLFESVMETIKEVVQ